MGLGARLGTELRRYPRVYRLVRGAYQRLREALGWERRAALTEVPTGAPSEVSVEITQRCNLNCPICYRHVTEMHDIEMSLADYRSILDQFPAIQSVRLVGKGETLIHRDIKSILTLHRERRLATTIVTNGHLLSPEIGQLLFPGSVVQISIDSPAPERYRAFRGAELAQVLKRTRDTISAQPEGITWVINTIVVTENLRDLPATVELAADLGCSAVNLYLPMLFSSDTEAMHPYQQRDLMEKMLEEASACAIRKRVALVCKEREGFSPGACLDPWYIPRISVTGDVYPCSYVYIANENTHTFRWAGKDIPVPQGNYIMGNLLRGDDMAAMWTGERFCALRRQVLSLERAEKRPCYNKLLETYLQDTSGVNFCDVCLYRHGIHC